MTATSAVAKTSSALTWAQTSEQRSRELFDGRAVPLRDLQQAQAELATAQNDARAAQATLNAARNRLRSLGRSDDDIAAFVRTGKISAETAIHAPISGVITQRKVGPGQYVTAGSGDPVYLLHGWPQNSHEWAKLVPLLSDRYTIVAPDLRGMGYSGRPDSGYDARTLGDDVHRLSSALGHDQIHVVGHDFGALAATASPPSTPNGSARSPRSNSCCPGSASWRSG